MPFLAEKLEANLSSTNFSFVQWRKQFPVFTHLPELIYLDSASTTQKPRKVIEAEQKFWEASCANPGRGSYPLAEHATEILQSVRKQVARFLGCADENEIVFTSGATSSLNLVAMSWGENFLQDGDRIHLCFGDHRALNDPWIALSKKLAQRGKSIEIVPYRLRGDGSIDLDCLLQAIDSKSRIINLAHVSNTAGVLNDLQALKKNLPKKVIVNGDLCQSISHTTINMNELGLDFASFSGHKVFASTGVGVLWIHPERHSEISPVFFGGGLKISSNAPFERLESGSIHLAGIISLSAALNFLNEMRENGCEEYLSSLSDYLFSRLLRMTHVELLYPPKPANYRKRVGIAAFRINGASSVEVGEYLAHYGIAVRCGEHCTGSQYSHLDSVRISLQVYNSFEEVERCCDLIENWKTSLSV